MPDFTYVGCGDLNDSDVMKDLQQKKQIMKSLIVQTFQELDFGMDAKINVDVI